MSVNLQLAAVGLGGWGKNIFRTCRAVKNANLTAFCDARDDVLKSFAAQCPTAQAVSNYADLLQMESVDAVLLATPAPMHCEMGMAALRAGKHVYIEKPMTLAVEDAEALVAEAARVKRILMVGHLLEYHSAIQQLKEMIDSGELGEILYVYSKRLNLGIVRRDENALWSLAPHDISSICYLLGVEPEQVVATGQAMLQPDIEDVVFVYLQFPGRLMAHIHVSWLDPHKERSLVVVGSQKMAVLDDMHPSEKIRVYDKSATVDWSEANVIEAISVRHGEIKIPIVSSAEPLKVEIQHFVDCVRSGAVPRSDGHDGLRVVRVLEGATRSLKQGGAPVNLMGVTA